MTGNVTINCRAEDFSFIISEVKLKSEEREREKGKTYRRVKKEAKKSRKESGQVY